MFRSGELSAGAAADTSALLALAACESLPLLDALFQEVRVPGRPTGFSSSTPSGIATPATDGSGGASVADVDDQAARVSELPHAVAVR
jgi:hypothetical protein